MVLGEIFATSFDVFLSKSWGIIECKTRKKKNTEVTINISILQRAGLKTNVSGEQAEKAIYKECPKH